MKAPKAPKEDPAIKAEREREKRISEGERRYAATRSASSMTTDYNAAYGRRSLFDRGTVAESAPLRETGGTGLQGPSIRGAQPTTLMQRDRTGTETAGASPRLTGGMSRGSASQPASASSSTSKDLTWQESYKKTLEKNPKNTHRVVSMVFGLMHPDIPDRARLGLINPFGRQSK